MKLRVVFAGTPEFALPSLDALAQAGHDVVAVLTQPDRPAGRGRRLQASPIKRRARELQLAVSQPATLKAPEPVTYLQALAPDIMVVAAYGLILPPSVLVLPRLGCVNVHASLLPRWRGAAPIQRALIAGDRETGISIMAMEQGLDTGPVYLEERIEIRRDDTGGSLHDRLARLGAVALMRALPGIASGELKPVPQPFEGVCYAHRIEKEEAVIDWTSSALGIERRIRAFNPWPVCETRVAGERLRIWSARARGSTPAGAAPGAVISTGSEGIDVATGEGILRLLQVQLAGRRPVSAGDFVNARPLSGVVLG